MDINSIVLQTSRMEGDPPLPPPQPRKRRRPALSCIQCRRRKIKCDRNMPCGQCISSKTSECQYSSDPAPHSKRSRVNENGQYPVTSSAVGHSPGSTTHASPNSNGGTDNAIRCILPNSTSFWAERTTIDEGPLPLRGQTTAPRQTPSDPTVQALLDRVHKLEQIISENDAMDAGPSLVNAPYVRGPSLRGSLSKTRFFGQSHWVNSIDQSNHLNKLKELGPLSKGGEVFDLLNKCKALGKKAKEFRSAKSLVPSEYRGYVPEKEISDRLVNAYFRTFESVYRILHIPTFEEEYASYWKDPEAADMAFVIKLLLVMAIGTTFYEDPIQASSLHPQAEYWIAAAQAWVSAPFEKHRLNIVGLQIHCLLLVARQVKSVGGDLTWISSGSVFHLAMSLGLHRDPVHFPKMGAYHAEMRRRLWATVLELSLQSSQDLGMSPLINTQDYDTQLPANIDDSEISETTKKVPVSKPVTTFTRTSIQISLMRTFCTRLEIAKAVNSFRNETSYEDTLRLGSTLSAASRSSSALLQSFLRSNSEQKPNPFQIKLHDFYSTHFLLALHRPYAIKAKVNPTYYFSRKVCLETSLSLLAPAVSIPGQSNVSQPDDWTLFTWISSGVIKGSYIHAHIGLGLELNQQLEEDPPLSLSINPPPPQQVEILRVLKIGRDWSSERIMRGDTNIKGHVFISCICGQVEALQKGACPNEAIITEARKSVNHCLQLMMDKYKDQETQTSAVANCNLSVDSGLNGVGWDAMMQDPNVNFKFPGDWVFSGWEDGNFMI
ncbi:C6 zinc finger domain-containing protein [Botrytis cinerea]